MCKKNILVTGAAGFIGSNLADSLLQNTSNTIIALDNFNDFYNKIKESNIKHNLTNENYILYKIDLLDKKSLEHVFLNNKIDVIVHLAAYAGVRPSIKNPQRYIDNNITVTLNILECMVKYKCKKIVFASSSSVYGNCIESIFTEDINLMQPISPYAMTKLSCEQMLYTFHHLYQIDVVALRFFTVYGKRQRPDLAIHKFTNLINQGLEIPVFGDGSTKRDYTYIDDIISGIISAIEYEKSSYEIINLGGGEPVTLSNMIEEIENALGKKALINRMNMQAGDVEKTVASIEKAKILLGYNPSTAFKDGISKFVGWFLENQKE